MVDGIIKCTTDPGTAIPWWSLMQQIDLIKVLLIKLIALMMVVYAFEMFQENAPEMAKQLAGPRYAARLGGITPSSVFAIGQPRSAIVVLETIDEAGAGFMEGWRGAQGGTIGRAIAGFQRASAAFQAGARHEASTWSLGLPDQATQAANNPGHAQRQKFKNQTNYLLYQRRAGLRGD